MYLGKIRLTCVVERQQSRRIERREQVGDDVGLGEMGLNCFDVGRFLSECKGKEGKGNKERGQHGCE